MHEKNLVPILVGMDHLGVHGCQMLVGFGTGMMMDGIDPSQKTYQLSINSKDYLVYDILYHHTRGKSHHTSHREGTNISSVSAHGALCSRACHVGCPGWFAWETREAFETALGNIAWQPYGSDASHSDIRRRG